MDFVIEQLSQNKVLFHNILKDCDEKMFLWKQSPEKWCLLEIVCHLYDEERDDFRFRTQWVLEKPNETPPPFDPINWVTEHRYIEQDYAEILDKFMDERQHSIDWLKTLENPKWDNAYEHTKMGTITAEYFFNNWLAHDYLHLRQILKLKFDYLKQRFGGNLNYAGAWN